jgi:hypothetical protein
MPAEPIGFVMPDTPHSQLFTLSLWREDLGGGVSEWRGKIRHVPSGETRYFRDWPTLIAFLQEWGSAPDDGVGRVVTSDATPPTDHLGRGSAP